jgi:hypothetical protein
MKATRLQDALGKPQLKPFDLHLDNGKTIRVKHPDCVLFNEPKTVAVVADGEHLHILHLDHVPNLPLAGK